ncbi:MAG: hypothetical protein JSW10_05045 [Pseudomonadota bacterium]|nr:MAG: hypothetical protein JSW10_05045 [Pseudomonadota bacterium]
MIRHSPQTHVSRLRRSRRLAGVLLIAVGVLALVGTALLFVQVIPDPAPGFLERKGTLADVRETFAGVLGDTTLHELTLTASSGLQVDLSVRVPRPVTGPQPLVLLLGGKRTGRDAVRLAPDTRGVALAALSYPHFGAADTNGASDGLALLLNLRQMQRALIDTTPAVLLALDYLLAQPYVDPRGVELVGVSLGAFLMSIPGALDVRAGRVWLVHGAGDPDGVLAHLLEQQIAYAPLRRAVGRLLGALFCTHHLRPERWVGQISPRPVIIINARGDEAFPLASIEALHRAAREPVEIIWTSGPHIMPGREQVVEQLAQLVLARVRADHNARVRGGRDGGK